MKIFPQAQITLFKECAPGELIRAPFHNSRFSIVAWRQGAKYIIQLQDEAGLVKPVFYLRSEPEELDQPVISYGTDYIIDVEQSSDNLEFGPQYILVFWPSDFIGVRLVPRGRAAQEGNGHWLF